MPDRSRPDPEIDRSRRFKADGTPRRPINDTMIALDMKRLGFDDDDIVHVLGYLPDKDGPLARKLIAGGA